MNGAFSHDYFIQQLSRIADCEPEQIISSRASALGAAESQFEERCRWTSNENAQTLSEIRANFWATPAIEIQEKLETINCQIYPEYTAAVKRLSAGLAAIDEWKRADSEMNASLRELLHKFKEMVAASPSKIAEIKESVFRNGLRYPAGQRNRDAAIVIRSSFPRIYAIDPIWIDSVTSETKIGNFWKIKMPIWVWFLLFAIFIAAMLLPSFI